MASGASTLPAQGGAPPARQGILIAPLLVTARRGMLCWLTLLRGDTETDLSGRSCFGRQAQGTVWEGSGSEAAGRKAPAVPHRGA